MKKIILLILAAVMVFSLASCFSPDGDDPKQPAEAQPSTSISETVLLDRDGVKITAKSLETGYLGEEVKIVMENKTDKYLSISIDNCSVNGIMMDPVCLVDLKAGETKNTSIAFFDSKFEEAGIEEIATIECSFCAVDKNTWGTYFESGIITLNTSVAETHKQSINVSGRTLYEKNNIKIILREITEDDISGPTVKVFIENKNASGISLEINSATVNGFWMEAFYIEEITGGKCAFSDITFSYSGIHDNGIVTLESAEFDIRILNGEGQETDQISITLP